MPYTAAQLIAAWTATTDGIVPGDLDASILTAFGTAIAAGTATDTQALTYVLNNADKTTAVANLAYLFFTGKSPTKAGLDYLVNSVANPTDLNDPYYTKFGLENRYINFAANLGVLGEGSLVFAATYGSMTFAAFVASVYEKVVGSSYATAAGLNATNAIADIVSRQAALTQIARDAGMITASSTAAQIDIALKAATAGYIMGEGIKADVGIYAAASNNFTFALLSGTPVYNVDLVTTYAALGGGLGSPVAPYFIAPVIPAGSTFRLTTGLDTFTGLAGNDTFNASDLQPDGITKAVVFNATDVLTGGLGTDTLNITSSAGIAYVSAAATVTGIEVATVTSDNTATVTAAAWSGLTGLTVTSVGSATVTAPATSTVAVNATLGTGTVTVDGGTNVTVAATGANANGAVAVNIGATTVPTGAINVSTSTTTAGGTAGSITTKGGTSVNITQTATNPFNTTLLHGAVSVTGTASTTSVTVSATKEATAAAGVAGVQANSVTVTDLSAGTATANTISTVALSGYWTSQINSSALTTLSLTSGNANVTIDNSGIVAPTNKTLGLTVNGTTGGILADGNIYTTLNVTTAGAASTLANITDTALTALTVTGSQVLTLTSAAGMTTLATVTVSGTAGLSGSFTQGTVTAINASGTSGAMTIALDATKATYTGGSGVDTVTLAAAPTKAVTGGTGIADVLVTTGALANASAAAFATNATGFERVTITTPAALTIDLNALGAYAYVSTAGGAGVTLDKLTAGGTLALTGTSTTTNLGTQNFGGTSDTLNLVLTSATGLTAFGTINGPGAETLVITTGDTQTTVTNPLHTATYVDASTKAITISGNAGLNLTQANNILTSVDASGITAGSFTYTSAALAGAAAIKGSATGTNTVTFSNALGIVTYTGGTGNDVIVVNNALANVINLGAGTNSLNSSAGGFTVTALGGNDTVTLGSGINSVNLGDGTNIFTGGTGADTYTGGGGADTISDLGGLNTVTTGAGADKVTTALAAGAAYTNVTTVTDFLSGTDKFDVPTVPTVLTGVGATADLNKTTTASTGVTTGTLTTDIGTAITALTAASFNDVGDTIILTITGATLYGTGVTYLLHNLAGAGFSAAADSVSILGGSSSLTLALADFI